MLRALWQGQEFGKAPAPRRHDFRTVNGMVRPCSWPASDGSWQGASKNAAIAVVGIDIGKNSFHAVGLGPRGAIVLRQKWSRGQVEARFANMPPRLIGMEGRVGAHHLSRRLKALGHNARPMGTSDLLSPPIDRTPVRDFHELR